MANVLDPTREQMVAMNAALDRAGVPQELRRYQEPVIVGRDFDIAWLRFECAMWKRSYEVSEYANSIIRKTVLLLALILTWMNRWMNDHPV